MHKTINYFLFLILVSNASAQLVSCRPKICMINYHFHNDNLSNPDISIIQNARPDILIDNTPGGYWGEYNNGVGCIPSFYTPLGIQVFSYIAGGYEATVAPSSVNNLSLNITRVDAISNDGATGVFLDEVSNYPTEDQKQYIIAIHSQCLSHGLKLILNPGTYDFDPWLMTHCDYIMTDENYDGNRDLSSSEAPFADRVLVVSEEIYDAPTAAALSIAAQEHSFGFSYFCEQYILLPTWLNNYMTQAIQEPPTAPFIQVIGNMLQSDGTTETQWYEQTLGLIAGATGQNFTPSASGYYYAVNNHFNCTSASSNIVYYNVLGVPEISERFPMQIFPNPTSSTIYVDIFGSEVDSIVISDLSGRTIITSKNANYADVRELSTGIYLLKAYIREKHYIKRFIKI